MSNLREDQRRGTVLRHLCGVFLAALVSVLGSSLASAGEAAAPTPAVDEPLETAAGSETAVLAGGCFWGVQEVFET